MSMINEPRRNDVGSAKRPTEWQEGAESRGPSKELIAFVVIAALAVAFVLGNTRKASIRFIAPEVEAPMWILVLVCIAIGVLLDRVLVVVARRRRRRED